MTGVFINLNIEYENKLFFWRHWPLGRLITYTYRAKEMDFGDQARFRVTKWKDLTTSDSERELYGAFGVLIQLSPTGFIGTTTVMKFVLSLVAALGMVKFARIFIEKVLVQFFNRLVCLNKYHEYFVFRYHTRDFTPRLP